MRKWVRLGAGIALIGFGVIDIYITAYTNSPVSGISFLWILVGLVVVLWAVGRWNKEKEKAKEKEDKQ